VNWFLRRFRAGIKVRDAISAAKTPPFTAATYNRGVATPVRRLVYPKGYEAEGPGQSHIP
jgi:hypothetical protein